MFMYSSCCDVLDIVTVYVLCEMLFSAFIYQEFGEAGTMLSATCDEFLKNLCDCVELAEGSFGELQNY